MYNNNLINNNNNNNNLGYTQINMNDNMKQPSIVDDFVYGSNVAQAHVTVRLGFLRKVYGILSVQLLFTTVVAAFIMASEGMQEILKTK